jgi:hypothetical protein
MKAIIWKELHENFKWALLGMVGVGLTMAFVLINLAYRAYSIGDDDFYLITLSLGPGVGAVIGFMQMIFDSRQGHWAVLVHRPIDRNRIFWGKTVAGLILYFAAMLIPFAISVLWVMIPGKVAGPFRWGMAVPGLVGILTGTAYYFAGMLVARRSARWYGSRCLPLVAPILCSILIFGVYRASSASLIIIVAASIMCIAARGSFLAGGDYKSQHWTAKSSLGSALVVGIILAGLATVGFISTFIPQSGYYRTTLQDSRPRLLRDGRVVVEEYVEGKQVAVNDLKGNPITELLRQDDESIDPLALLIPPRTNLDLAIEEEANRGATTVWHRRSVRSMRAGLHMAPGTYWYYLPETGRFEAYDEESRRRIGSIGPNGFASADQTPTDRFPSRRVYSEQMLENLASLFPTPDGVYRIDLMNRTVEPVFTPEPGKHIELMQGIEVERLVQKWRYSNGTRYRDHETEYEKVGYAMLVDKEILLLDQDLKVLRTHTPDYQSPDYSSVTISKLDTPDTYAFMYRPSVEHFGDQAFDMTRPLVIYGPDDQPVSTGEVPPRQYESGQLPITQGFVGLIAPPAPCAIIEAVERIRNRAYRRYNMYDTNLKITFGASMLLGGIISLLVNLRLAKRNALGRGQRIVWASLGLLFGLSGVLLMLCLLPWPTKLRCESCGKARLVNRFDCEHCGATFAPPATDGTEIFDRPDSTPARPVTIY